MCHELKTHPAAFEHNFRKKTAVLFGEKSDFAVQCELENEPTNFFNCFICLWVGGMQVGNYKRGGSLKSIVPFVESSLKDGHYSQSLFNKDADNAFNVIWNGLYGSGNENRGTEILNQDWQYYHHFDAFGASAPAFDGWGTVIINGDTSQRLIWRDFEKKITYEIKLPLGYYENVITLFLRWATQVVLER